MNATIDPLEIEHIHAVISGLIAESGRLQAGRLAAAAPELLEIVQRLALATDEGDDAARGTHYVDKAGVIRCKGSFLALVEEARAAVTKAMPQ